MLEQVAALWGGKGFSMILEYKSSLLEERVCEESVAPASVCWAVMWDF